MYYRVHAGSSPSVQVSVRVGHGLVKKKLLRVTYSNPSQRETSRTLRQTDRTPFLTSHHHHQSKLALFGNGTVGGYVPLLAYFWDKSLVIQDIKMNSGKRTLQASMSSLIDLKAELLRKQEALKQQRLKQPQERQVYIKQKSASTVWDCSNAGVKERAKKDAKDIPEEHEDLQRSRAALEQKAKIYEKLTSGRVMPDDEQNELYMVNFQQKAVDFIIDKKKQMEETSTEKENGEGAESDLPATDYDDMDKEVEGTDEEWVDYTDSLGRSRRCLRKDLSEIVASDKDLTGKTGTVESDVPERTAQFLAFEKTREQLRQQWEVQEAQNATKGDVHYGDVRFEEAREHGVGFYDLSGDAMERKKQLELLNKLREQTIKQKEASIRMKEKRKAMLEARLARIRQKKNIKTEGDEDKKDSENDDEEDQEKLKEEGTTLEPEPEANEVEMEAWKVPEIRPWDEGKNLAEVVNRPQYKRKFSQRDWVDKQRDERIGEFAPPPSYSGRTPTPKYANFAQGPMEFGSTRAPQQSVHSTGRLSTEDLIAQTLAEIRRASDGQGSPL